VCCKQSNEKYKNVYDEHVCIIREWKNTEKYE
jgi:hypothetical protein